MKWHVTHFASMAGDDVCEVRKEGEIGSLQQFIGIKAKERAEEYAEFKNAMEDYVTVVAKLMVEQGMPEPEANFKHWHRPAKGESLTKEDLNAWAQQILDGKQPNPPCDCPSCTAVRKNRVVKS